MELERMDAGRTALLTEGFSGIDRQIDKTFTAMRSPRKREALQALRGYLQPHEHHLAYRRRLATGKSIGSGQVEGACKNLFGRRLKQTSARWKVRRANRMAGLCCLLHGHHWNTFWKSLHT